MAQPPNYHHHPTFHPEVVTLARFANSVAGSRILPLGCKSGFGPDTISHFPLLSLSLYLLHPIIPLLTIPHSRSLSPPLVPNPGVVGDRFRNFSFFLTSDKLGAFSGFPSRLIAGVHSFHRYSRHLTLAFQTHDCCILLRGPTSLIRLATSTR
ncbi:hypothetical protein P175DRAFT_090467 [Aspergillus ochraceoroseus IBT 24754]|uniref:Uncharacterized protein n=1 Tax=Aspergillus ochraceoroseus IBT 24754 TaxID=1392256 RepID=A0A2T5LMG3_9EURO|nr:uncharacterized protein P175DRAFT_090467 [Aspergillus ochraceoroseus IBT 24754]PTU17478.1 hypothetical protein P175DRAFT_090467 [Aspergillus ochraceoroseus IBT 24754]